MIIIIGIWLCVFSLALYCQINRKIRTSFRLLHCLTVYSETKKTYSNNEKDPAQVLSSFSAAIKSGGHPRAQIEKLAGKHFACKDLSAQNISEIFISSEAHNSHSREQQAMLLGNRLALAVHLSAKSGCKLSYVIDAVSGIYCQQREIDGLRSSALSIPQATFKLLCALPFLTLGGGEVMGAHSAVYLLTTIPGRILAVVGVLFYCGGIVWMRRVLADFLGIDNAHDTAYQSEMVMKL